MLMHTLLATFTLVCLLHWSTGQRFGQRIGNQVCLLVPPEVEACYRRFNGKPIDTRAAQVNCLQKLLWSFPSNLNLSQSDLDFFRSLLPDQGHVGGVGLPPTGRRVRREYRLMSPRERQRLHAALNKLYEDGTIARFARLHAVASDWHYNGPSFLPWNRVFLAMFEEALRRHDPTVFLPYWDSTIDYDMDNPVNSVIWSPEYFGAGVGDVVDGPAAEWVTNLGTLERDYGRRSRLLSKDQIRHILSQCNLRDISKPFATRHYDIEYFQGGPHHWVGGDMRSVHSAAFDPVFFMHHAFVDYVWELFRRRQFRRCGVDPAQDYPDLSMGNSHAADARMVGFDWLTNRDGIKYDWVDSWYDYESTPSCPNCCEGCAFPAPIYCDKIKNVCVARSRRAFAFGPFDDRTRSAAHLDPREIYALNNNSPPRNRGREFQAPTSDGRTIHTAIDNTFDTLRRQEDWRVNGNRSSGSFGQTVSGRPLGEFIEPFRDQRRPLFEGAQTQPSLQMAARQSANRRVLTERARPPQVRTFRDNQRRDRGRALLDSPSFDRPVSISDAPISLTDVRTSFSTRARPAAVDFSSADTRTSNVSPPRVIDSRGTLADPQLESRGITDIRLSSFDVPSAPADRGRGPTSSDPLVAYASPEMSLFERPSTITYQDPMVLPDRRDSIPARRREYIGGQTRTLPDPRKILVSRTRRIQPASPITFHGSPEVSRPGRQDQGNLRPSGVSERRTSSGRQYLDFTGR